MEVVEDELNSDSEEEDAEVGDRQRTNSPGC